VLNEAQEDAFEAYIQGGGGYTGIHSASDTEYEWPWYGDLVGGYFRNHPPGTPTATVGVEDHDHPSTTGQPESYVKVDEWYNFQSPENPVVGGGGDDYSPRDNVHVLATVDESTYDEQDGNATDDDHPIIWCQRYDGGRSWYTALGHTQASFGEEEFLQQLLGGLETTAGVEPSATCGVEPGPPPGPGPGPPSGPPSGPPPTPGQASLDVSVKPTRIAVAPGDKATFTAKVSNEGDAAASDVSVCAKGPKSKVKMTGEACAEPVSLAAGEADKSKFKLKAKPLAGGKQVRVSFKATSPDAATARDRVTLMVER
jgi:type 1 glutamine amidotransferase